MREYISAEANAAMQELKARGFTFMVHFGYANAEEILREMDHFAACGMLYEFLTLRFGPNGY